MSTDELIRRPSTPPPCPKCGKPLWVLFEKVAQSYHWDATKRLFVLNCEGNKPTLSMHETVLGEDDGRYGDGSNLYCPYCDTEIDEYPTYPHPMRILLTKKNGN